MDGLSADKLRIFLHPLDPSTALTKASPTDDDYEASSVENGVTLAPSSEKKDQVIMYIHKRNKYVAQNQIFSV